MWKSHLPSEDGEALSCMEGTRASGSVADGDQQLSQSSSDQPQWFAVYTSTHHEKHVCDALLDHSIETFLPLYAVARRWKKSRPGTQQLPLFPNYLFVRLHRRERGRVLNVSGVLSIVGSGRAPWPIPQEEIEVLRSAMAVRNFEPHPYIAVGDRVRVKAGPLSGLEGILIRKKSGTRVVLSMHLIMMSTAVEVDAEDLEPAVPKPICASYLPGMNAYRASGYVA